MRPHALDATNASRWPPPPLLCTGQVLPRVSIVVPFLVNQFYGWDPIIEILANQKKNYNGDYR